MRESWVSQSWRFREGRAKRSLRPHGGGHRALTSAWRDVWTIPTSTPSGVSLTWHPVLVGCLLPCPETVSTMASLFNGSSNAQCFTHVDWGRSGFDLQR